jgi:predicted TPR repeat methyltransferase
MTPRGDASRDEAYFDKLYATNPDPWDFATSPYEQRKYQASLAALGPRRFAAGFEIGCSIGVFTALLAPRCAALLAVDAAAAPLQAAAQRCAAHSHVHFEKRIVPRDWPAQMFDLIVFSEVLYFLNRADVWRCAALARRSLLPHGRVFLVNYTAPIDEPCGGDEAAEHFRAAFSGRHAHHSRTESFRIDILQNSRSIGNAAFD